MAISPQGIEAHAQGYAINADILYAADFLATMALIQALNDDLIAKCALIAGCTPTAAYNFTNGDYCLVKTQTAGNSSTKAASTEFVGVAVAAVTPAAATTAKAWVQFNAAGEIQGTGYNITSVTKTDTGKYTIVWDTNFADDDYAPVCTAIGSTASSTTLDVRTITTEQITVEAREGSTLADRGGIVIVFGTQ